MSRSSMGRMKCALIGIAVCSLSLPTLAQEFRADLVEGRGTGKVYVKGKKHRLERGGSDDVYVVTDLDENVCRVFLIQEKKYLNVPADDFRSMSNDPFVGAKFIADRYDAKKEGSEEVSGYACDKVVISTQGQIVMTIWTSTKLGFVLKTMQLSGDTEVVMVLENIKEEPQADSLFAIPDGFEEMEDPAAARKRLIREMEEKEAALPVLTAVGSDAVPCRTRVGVGGELRVPVDADRPVSVRVYARGKEGAEATVLPFLKGSQVQSIGVSPWSIDVGRSQNRDFNDSFFSGGAFQVDELRIQVAKGTVFVSVEQSGIFAKDQFNAGNTTRQFEVLLGRGTKLEVTGANPFGDETKGTVMLETEGGGKAEVVEFVVETGKTKTWDFPADKRLTKVHVSIKFAEGAARISLRQPTPAEIDVQELAVTTEEAQCYVDAGRALVLTMTAGAKAVKGTIRLERADRFSSSLEVDLAPGETKTWTVAKDKQTVQAKFQLSSGSATVKLDQSG